MQKIYTSIKCCRCKKEFVLVTEDYKSSNGYLVCPYCSSKNVKKENESDSVKECMKENSYKRKNGALRQVRRE